MHEMMMTVDPLAKEQELVSVDRIREALGCSQSLLSTVLIHCPTFSVFLATLPGYPRRHPSWNMHWTLTGLDGKLPSCHLLAVGLQMGLSSCGKTSSGLPLILHHGSSVAQQSTVSDPGLV
nr:uncharacterized protein LOC105494665 isoform X2 [Macaca nemestrina]